jgi:hypothetical protein
MGTTAALCLAPFVIAGLLSLRGPLVYAGVPDSIFYISPESDNITFEVREVPRGEVLERLTRHRAIQLEWRDPSFATELISGAFKGNMDTVLRRLLSHTNSIMVYEQASGVPRLSKIIIVGTSGQIPPNNVEKVDPRTTPKPGKVDSNEMKTPTPSSDTKNGIIPPHSTTNPGPQPGFGASVPAPPATLGAIGYPPSVPTSGNMPSELLPPMGR